MHEHRPNQRISASKAFEASLEQLQNILAQDSQTAESESEWSDEHETLNLNISRGLEDAAADIDKFFGDA